MPEESDVRNVYADGRARDDVAEAAAIAEFDRWLAEHDRYERERLGLAVSAAIDARRAEIEDDDDWIGTGFYVNALDDAASIAGRVLAEARGLNA